MGTCRVLFLLLALALLSALSADGAERGRGGGGKPPKSSYEAYDAPLPEDGGGGGGRGPPRAGGGGGAPDGPACTPARSQPAALNPAVSLPNRVLRNRDPTFPPLIYFEVGRELGGGAFGKVMLASLKAAKPAVLDTLEEKPARFFALKEQSYDHVIPCGNDPRPAMVRRSSRTEPQFMERVNGGPYIIRYWGSWYSRSLDGKKKRAHFTIAMSKAVSDLESELLGTGRFYKRPGIPEDKARIIIGQLVIAIGFMHSKGIIHRDFKPGNILLDAKRRPMVADFGCAIDANRVEQDLSEAGVCDYRIRAPEAMVYPAFIDAPKYSYEADWWSLGVVTHNILTGTGQLERGDTNGPFVSRLAGMARYSQYWYDQHKNQATPRREDYLDRAKLARLSPDARSFVLALLEFDPARRLGTYSGDGKKGWEAVMCHPFLAPLDPNRLMAAGARQAEELGAPLVFDTRTGKPPNPKEPLEAQLAPKAPKVSEVRAALKAASDDAYAAYEHLVEDRQPPKKGAEDPYLEYDEAADGGKGGAASGGKKGSGDEGGSYEEYEELADAAPVDPAPAKGGKKSGGRKPSRRGLGWAALAN